MVKVHGNRSITQRNRRFLRKLSPFKPVNPVPQAEGIVPHPVTMQQPSPVEGTVPTPDPQQTPDRVTTRSQKKTMSSPNSSTHSKMINPASLATRAASHRMTPLASPGKDIVTELRNKEKMGSHLSIEN